MCFVSVLAYSRFNARPGLLDRIGPSGALKKKWDLGQPDHVGIIRACRGSERQPPNILQMSLYRLCIVRGTVQP